MTTTVDGHVPPAPMISVSERERIARHLAGDGIEVGPGGQAFPVPPGARVRYVDRWRIAEARELYPEVAAETFVEPDVVTNFDVERLGAFSTCSLDFVIASHVLEHLADPLGFLIEMHRVLRPGGLAIVLLPDRRRTFDSGRPPTPLEHLIEDHARRPGAVSDDHIQDFLGLVDKHALSAALAEGWSTDDYFEWHRRRSIHVHCWTEAEFHRILLYVIVGLGVGWEIVDNLRLADVGLEFGYVLRRSCLRSVWERLGNDSARASAAD
jgi:SAM-dependent methyltransferase